ncbi:MAG: hypothetical protein R2747_15230 [Pyrinomonadaceae bacterium]
MGRIILGAAAGFIVWSVLWIVSNELLAVFFPVWYGARISGYQESLTTGAPFILDADILIVSLLRGALCSVLAGYLSVSVARKRVEAAYLLGLLLLLVGILMHALTWEHLPLWYHFLFWFMLIPMTVLGGKLRSDR